MVFLGVTPCDLERKISGVPEERSNLQLLTKAKQHVTPKLR